MISFGLVAICGFIAGGAVVMWAGGGGRTSAQPPAPAPPPPQPPEAPSRSEETMRAWIEANVANYRFTQEAVILRDVLGLERAATLPEVLDRIQLLRDHALHFVSRN